MNFNDGNNLSPSNPSAGWALAPHTDSSRTLSDEIWGGWTSSEQHLSWRVRGGPKWRKLKFSEVLVCW
jgi:hypothetical protein